MARKNALPLGAVELAELARRQWGVVTREQLIESGLGDSGVRDWVQSGRIRRLHRGVYAFGHDRLRIEGSWLAAVMACGPGAVLSHRDAAQLWELRQSQSEFIDVTVPSQNGRIRRRGVRVHRSGRLAAEEVTTRSGIPVTTVARTLLDLADVLPRQALRRAVTEAEYTGRFDLTALIAVVESNPGRRTRKLGEPRAAGCTGRARPWRSASSCSSSATAWRSRGAASGSRATRRISSGRERPSGAIANGIASSGGRATGPCG
jgi:hypothetical protein